MKRGGDHVVRQGVGQVGCLADDVGDQPLVALGDDDGRVGDAWLGDECGSYFAEFDAVAADLDLVVDAAEELDGSVVPPAGEVSGAVHAAARRAVYVREELVGGAGRVAHVAAGHAGAADEEFAHGADGDGLEVGVEDTHGHVGQGAADGHDALD